MCSQQPRWGCVWFGAARGGSSRAGGAAQSGKRHAARGGNGGRAPGCVSEERALQPLAAGSWLPHSSGR